MSKKKPLKKKTGATLPILGVILGLLSVVSVFWVMFCLFRNRTPIEKSSNVLENSQLNSRQKKILSVLQERKELTIDEIVPYVDGVSERTLRRDMFKLESLGYSKKLGSTKGTKYIFIS